MLTQEVSDEGTSFDVEGALLGLERLVCGCKIGDRSNWRSVL